MTAGDPAPVIEVSRFTKGDPFRDSLHKIGTDHSWPLMTMAGLSFLRGKTENALSMADRA
jgi:hypothetical protein